MHFAFVSSICKPTHPNAKGGQEVWAASFLQEEIKRDHTFDLYAVKGSIEVPGKINLISVLEKGKDEVKFDPFFEQSKNKKSDLDAFTYATYSKVQSLLQKHTYDAIIDSSGNPLLPLNADLFTVPIIVIGHFPVEKQYVKFFQYKKLPQNVHFAMISKFQYDKAAWIPDSQKSIIPNGIIIDSISYTEKEPLNLFWMGRVDPDMPKGSEEAIRVAIHTNRPIDVFPYIEKDAEEYVQSTIMPLVAQRKDLVNFTTSSTYLTINERLAKAKAFLFPVKWEEPFGLVMVESMATGTPVIAYARGAVPEIVQDGRTGFIVNSSDEDIRGNWIIKKTGIEGLIEAVQRMYTMQAEDYLQMRKNSRTHIEKNFTVQHMVDGYEKLYNTIRLSSI